MEEQDKIEILEEKDVVVCRQACRNWAKRMNFNLIDQTRITTAVSELARNIQEYAGQGEVQIQIVEKDMRRGLRIIFIDHGPGIKNIKLAMSEGWTSHRGMGMGLPGAKRLMDEFALESEAGKGTTVTTCKWLPL
ncbi:anti-sigma regulatory factor [bacterium]|nr:anti-sigma regulatory factor [FCB group bacterium]MBL7191793.1 anti-sigma regulatory factor [bacterium]